MRSKPQQSKNKCLDSVDLFSRPVHSFTFEGRSHIYSVPGVFCSVLALILIAFFTLTKLWKVVQTTGYRVINAVPNPEGVNLAETNF